MALRKAGSAGSVSRTDPVPASPSKALLAYNALRAVLLVVCIGLAYLAGLRGVLMIVVGLAVSGILSWFLLAKQRIGMGIAVEQAVTRGRVKLAERTAAEDEYADSLRRQQVTPLAQQAAEDQRRP